MNKLPKGTKALIFAAGLGTRLKPFTDFHPKALAIVNGKTLLQRNIQYLQSFGINDFVINVHHFADQIINFLQTNDNFGAAISISHEIDQPLETGGGLLFAREHFQNCTTPFIIMNADILTNLNIGEMYNNYLKSTPLVSLAITNRTSSRNLLFNQDKLLCGWENTKTGEKRISRNHENLNPKAFSCVHIVNPTLLSLITQKGVFSIIDTYLDLAKNHIIIGYEHSNDLVVDVGKPESIFEAEKYFK
jgi:NDP-sugar pyrophosphorylase family protein